MAARNGWNSLFARLSLVVLASGAALLVGCGGSGDASSEQARVALDPALVGPSRIGMVANVGAAGFVLPWENTFGGTLGSAFNSVSDEVIQKTCIEFQTETFGSVQQESNFQVYDTVEELAMSMEATYSTSANYGIFKSSASARVLSNLSLSSNTVYAHAWHRVWGPGTMVTNAELKPDYKSLAVEELVAKCGDHYLGNFARGAQLDAVLAITTSSREEKLSVQVDLSAKVAGAKTNKSLRSDLGQYLAQHNASISVISRGCKPIAVQGATLEAFYDASDQFFESVTECIADPDNATLTDRMTFYSLAPYANVTTSEQDRMRSLVSDKRAARDDLLFARMEYLKLIADIDDILSDKDSKLLYVWNDPGKYTAAELENVVLPAIGSERERKGLLGTTLAQAISNCEDHPLACAMPPIEPQFTVDGVRERLPAHTDFFPANCAEIWRHKHARSGKYFIYLGGSSDRRLPVYCQMDTGGQLDYLELADFNDVSDPNQQEFYQPAPGRNFSQVVNDYAGDQSRPDQVTSFRKIRVDPKETTVEVALNDFTFAQTYTNPTDPARIPSGHPASYYYVPFGTAVGGRQQTGGTYNPYIWIDMTKDNWFKYTQVTGYDMSGWGRARVDVSALPLRISNRTQWSPSGIQAQGLSTFSADRKIVDVIGRGIMGRISPSIVEPPIGQGEAKVRPGIELDYVVTP